MHGMHQRTRRLGNGCDSRVNDVVPGERLAELESRQAPMRSIRGQLVAVALATLAIHMLVVTLGALRVCWGVEHTHAGAAAADCPMHHHANSQPAQHAYHSHGSDASATSDAAERVRCGCSNDPSSLYVGPTAIIPVPTPASPSMQVMMLAPESEPSPSELCLSSPSPPPRSTISQLS